MGGWWVVGEVGGARRGWGEEGSFGAGIVWVGWVAGVSSQWELWGLHGDSVGTPRGLRGDSEGTPRGLRVVFVGTPWGLRGPPWDSAGTPRRPLGDSVACSLLQNHAFYNAAQVSLGDSAPAGRARTESPKRTSCLFLKLKSVKKICVGRIAGIAAPLRLLPFSRILQPHLFLLVNSPTRRGAWRATCGCLNMFLWRSGGLGMIRTV